MKKILLAIFILLILLTGCSYKELDQLAICSVLGIDYRNNMYIVTAEIINPKKEQNKIATQESIIYTGSGKTINLALNDMAAKYPKILYLSHMEVLILNKNILEEKTDDMIKYFLNHPEVLTDFLVLTSNEISTKEIIILKNESTIPLLNNEITSILKNAALYKRNIKEIHFEDFIHSYYKEGTSPSIPLIEENSDHEDPFYPFKISSMMILKNNKLKKEGNNNE